MKWIISGNSFTNSISSPKTFFIEEYTPQMVKALGNCISEAISSNQPLLPVQIESDGGSVACLGGVLSWFDFARQNGLKIATIVSGHAMSSGAITLCYGCKGLRYAGSSSVIMLHNSILYLGGKILDTKRTVNVLDDMWEKLKHKISKHLGKREDWLTKKFKLMDNSDWFLTPEQAKNEGIIDHIGIPNLKMEMEAKFSIRC